MNGKEVVIDAVFLEGSCYCMCNDVKMLATPTITPKPKAIAGEAYHDIQHSNQDVGHRRD